MKSLFQDIKTTILATLVLAVICCGIYPLVVFGLGQLLFAHKANGSLITDKSGQVVGSELLGQNFSSDKYFHGRPSAAGSGYDGSNSGGTNLGPTSQKLADSVKAAVAQYRKENSLPDDFQVPADAVTSSASGLDPHISPANAEIQIARVAKARQMDADAVRKLVTQYTDGAWLGMLGDPGVNVLRLNLALDEVAPMADAPAAPAPAAAPATTEPAAAAPAAATEPAPATSPAPAPAAAPTPAQ